MLNKGFDRLRRVLPGLGPERQVRGIVFMLSLLSIFTCGEAVSFLELCKMLLRLLLWGD